MAGAWRAVIGGLALACAAPIAHGQAAPPPKPATKPAAEAPTVRGVVVTGAQPGLRVSIDRKSYDVSKDLQATTGAIGDALRNIPSVDVDAQGNLSLRGDPNVTILIDGKPSGLFRGPGRAAALQSLPADQIERVEVITNPSADQSPEGSAGVINLISKQVRKPGASGGLRATYGSEGRDTAGLNAAFNSNRLSLSGDVSLRHDPQKYTADVDRRSLEAASGDALTSQARSQGRGQGHIRSYRLSGDYDLDKATRVSAEARRTSMVTGVDRVQAFQGEVAANAPPVAYVQSGPLRIANDDTEASLGYRRTFAGDGHTLTGQLRFDETDNDYRQAYLQTGDRPPGTAPFNASRQAFSQGEAQAKLDYVRPLPAEAKLKAGLDVRHDDDVFATAATAGSDAAGAQPDPAQASRFHYLQTIAAAYTSYERPFGDLTVLGGLRLEDVRIETHEFSGDARSTRDTVSAYPSLHLAWKLDDARQLTASYGRRVQRPSPSELNPFASCNNLICYAGNPALEPAETRSYEAGYQRHEGPKSLLVTVFWRDSRKLVTDVSVVQPDGVLLRTRQNLGRSQSGGLEAAASGKLTATLSFNASATAAWTQIDAANLGFHDRRQATTLSGRASLSWQPTPNDFAQISGFAVGDRLTPQGRQTPIGMLNLGYRRKLTDQLALLLTANDILATLGGRIVVDTPALHDVTRYTNNARAVFIGLTWTFGGQKAPREPAFDFGGGPGS